MNVRKLLLSLACGLGPLCGLAGVAAKAHAQLPGYSVINLGVVGNPVTANALNDDYQVVGSYTVSGTQKGFFWAPGIPAVQLTGSNAATGIDDLGDITGSLTSSGTVFQEVWYPVTPYGSSFNDNGILPGGGLTAGPNEFTGITDDGYLTGWMTTAGGTLCDNGTFFDTNGNLSFVSKSASTSEGLGVVPGLGTAVGFQLGGAEIFDRASGTGTALTLPGFITNPSSANAVDSAFDMVGYATGGAANAPLPMFFYLGAQAAVVLPMPSYGISGSAAAVNPISQLIGGSCNSIATLWTGSFKAPGAMAPVNANSLLRPHSQWHLQTVTGINDDGAFVGEGIYQQKRVAYLAIPVVLQDIATDLDPVVGGNHVVGTVDISAPAPFDMTIQLVSYGTGVKFSTGSYSATVVIPAGDTTVSFPITTATVTVNEHATLRANYGGRDVYWRLTVIP